MLVITRRLCGGSDLLNVGVKGVNPLVLLQVGNILDHVLVGSVVHKNVDVPTERLDSTVDNLLAVFAIRQVGGHQVALASIFLHALLGFLSIILFLREVDDEAVGTLHGEEDGYSPADATVSACDDGLLALELAGSLVELVAAIAGGDVLVLGSELELGLQTRLGDLLDRDLVSVFELALRHDGLWARRWMVGV